MIKIVKNKTGKFTINGSIMECSVPDNHPKHDGTGCNVKNFNMINLHYTKFLAYENKKKIVVSNKR